MFFRRRKKSAQRSPVRRSRPSLEVLEDRLAPAIITVTGTADTIAVDNQVTLREAIASANGNANENADVVAVGAYGTTRSTSTSLAYSRSTSLPPSRSPTR